MNRCRIWLLVPVVWLAVPLSARADLRGDFADPPLEYKTRPLWFWNAAPSRAQTRLIMQQCRESGYYGFGILPTEKMGLPFMSPEFLDRYQEALDAAAELGLKMCLYDEFWFPSGGAGGLLAKQYPEALGKRLDMVTYEVTGPQAFTAAAPPGTLMAAVAMHRQTKERLDLTGRVRNGRLAWDAPAGPWQVMLFTCVPDGARGLVDYLDPEAVRKFIRLTYEKYYERFPQHFGRTIDSAFYDEPTFHWIQGGRAWTPSLNARFQEKYGRHPALLYPALWGDIGPETAAARNALFGLRAEMFATGFVMTINDWCRAHKIQLTGHVDQEEVVNPVGLCGDLMRSFQHQDIPGVDQIFQYGRAAKAYKVISSAATNYGKRIVMCECYGAIKDMPVANLYKEAMDQFAKGVNLFVPHAVWYDPAKIMFPPELSYRSPLYGPELPAYNRYMGRLQRILQHGEHVADIGVLYPIATLQSGYRFGVGTPYTGGIIPAEADYMDVGERLMLDVRHDFTFVHPDVLDERGVLSAEPQAADRAAAEPEAGVTIRLDHTRQQYRVFVLPGSTTIRLSNLQKIKAFYDRGGQLIATTRLPDRSADFGQDATVQQIVREMFGVPDAQDAKSAAPPVGFTKQVNAAGGRAYFAPAPTAAALQAILAEAFPVPDVAWEQSPRVAGGNLSYMHKVVEGRDVFFFANSSDTAAETHVRLRGRMQLEWWDPHTGTISQPEVAYATDHGQPVTRVKLALPPVRSCFLVGPGS
jgi:hypothetical protein